MICQHDQPDQRSGLDDFCCVDSNRAAGTRVEPEYTICGNPVKYL